MLALIWRPYFSPTVVVVVAVLLAALSIFAWWRARGLAPFTGLLALLMRLGLVAVLTALLMGPSVVPESDTVPGRPGLTILLDTSGSMLTEDMGGQSRFAFITERWLSERRLEALRRDYDVTLLAFDESPRPITDAALRLPPEEVATGRVTNLIGSISATLAAIAAPAGDEPGRSLLVLSDGRDTFGETAGLSSVLSAGRGVPIHTATFGGPSLQRDLSVVAVPLQEYLLAGEEGEIAVRVIGSGARGATTTLRMTGPGVDIRKPVEFDDMPAVRFTLPVRHDEPGQYEYEVSVEPLEDEVELRNNRQPVFVEVTRQRLCVLLLEGSPFWDTRFLAQSLRKDDRIELTQIVQVSPQRQQRIVSRVDVTTEARASSEQRRAARVPQTIEAWKQYDVVILGTGMENVLDPDSARMLRQYVTDHGGRVVLARGRAYASESPIGGLIARELAMIEPVVWSDHTLRDQQLVFLPAGLNHPSLSVSDDPSQRERLLRELPGLTTAPGVERAKAGAQVLATTSHVTFAGVGGETQPAIAAMQVGRGAVLAILGEGLWRWSLVGRENRELAGVFDRFWSNSIRWLVMGGEFQPGQEIAVRLSRRSLQLGDPLTIDVSDRGMAPRDVTLTIVDPEGNRHTLATAEVPGGARQRATFTPGEGGVYEVIAEAPGLDEPIASSFNVYEIDIERLECSADPHMMRLIAEESGGVVLDPYEPDAIDEILSRQREAVIVPPRPRYVWNHAWVMALLLSWLGCEWLVRKGGGLL